MTLNNPNIWNVRRIHQVPHLILLCNAEEFFLSNNLQRNKNVKTKKCEQDMLYFTVKLFNFPTELVYFHTFRKHFNIACPQLASITVIDGTNNVWFKKVNFETFLLNFPVVLLGTGLAMSRWVWFPGNAHIDKMHTLLDVSLCKMCKYESILPEATV